MIGLPVTMRQTIESLGMLGRAVIVGLGQAPLEVHPYQTLIGQEAEIIGSNDHLLEELPLLIDLARRKDLDTSHVVSQTIPLDAGKINGRDHNHYGFTVWMAGGGVKGGQVYGATDEFGFQDVENPVHVHDLHATMLHLLGFDHERLTYRYAGRDFRLTDVHGQVVKELVA